MVKLSKIFFRCYFHCKLFRDTPVEFFFLWGGGGGYGIYMGLEYIFRNFLINRCKGREILEGLIENFIPLPPKVNWTPYQSSFCAVADKQIDAPPTHPHQSKRRSGLRMKMKPNQDLRGDAKSERHGHAIAYARVYPEPSVSSVSPVQSVRPVSQFIVPR